jgi:hypothetical protein
VGLPAGMSFAELHRSAKVASKPVACLHSPATEKAGLFRPPPGLPNSRRSANPPRHYHIGCAQKTAQKKLRRGAGLSLVHQSRHTRACRDRGKPAETIPQSVAQGRGDSRRLVGREEQMFG